MNFDFCQAESEEKYQLRDMHARPVFVRKLNSFERLMHPNCIDCGSEGGCRVFEITPENGFPQIWTWCGLCDIGG